MAGKMLQLFVTTLLSALLTNQTQGGPLGDFPIKTFPRVLSDVTRIVSEAREEIGETRSWLQAIISRLSNAAPDLQEQVRGNEDANAELKCQSYQLAFDRSATICVDVEFKAVFDDIAHVVTGGSIEWPNRDEFLEKCAKETGKQGVRVVQDGADTSREGASFTEDEGSGQAQEVENDPARVQKFKQDIEKEISVATTLERKREINEVENLAKSAAEIGGENNEDSETKSPLEMKVSDDDSIIKIEEKTKIFVNCLKNRFNILTQHFPVFNVNEHTRNKRGSLSRGPVPRIIITLSF